MPFNAAFERASCVYCVYCLVGIPFTRVSGTSSAVVIPTLFTSVVYLVRSGAFRSTIRHSSLVTCPVPGRPSSLETQSVLSPESTVYGVRSTVRTDLSHIRARMGWVLFSAHGRLRSLHSGSPHRSILGITDSIHTKNSVTKGCWSLFCKNRGPTLLEQTWSFHICILLAIFKSE